MFLQNLKSVALPAREAFGRPSDEANLHHFFGIFQSQKPHIFLSYIPTRLPRDYFLNRVGVPLPQHLFPSPLEPHNISFSFVSTVLDE